MKNVCLALGICLATLAPAPSPAETVHVVSSTSDFVFEQAGKAVGPVTEMVEKTLAGAGVSDYSISLYPWARAFGMAQTEPNVLIYVLARTPEREAQFQWVGEFVRVRVYLYKLKARSDISAANLDAARNYTVGVIRDDSRHYYLKTHGFTQLVGSPHDTKNFMQLLERQVDMVPLTERAAALLCAEARFDCAGLEKVMELEEMNNRLFLAFSKSTPPELVARTQAAFEQLRSNGTLRRLLEPAKTVPVAGK